MGSTDFSVLATPGTPLVIAPTDSVEFTVEYLPTVSGTLESAIIRIASNDPTAPFVDVAAIGVQGTGAVATAIADSGNFGNVCLGSFKDELLTINNTGTCPLSIFDIASSDPNFQAPSVVFYPLIVNPGTSIDLTIRFQPLNLGLQGGVHEDLLSAAILPARLRFPSSVSLPPRPSASSSRTRATLGRSALAGSWMSR